MFTQEFSGYKWEPFYAMVGGGIPVDEVPVALQRRADKYQVMRTHIEVTKPGKHKMRLQGNLSQMSLFLGSEEIEFHPREMGQIFWLIVKRWVSRRSYWCYRERVQKLSFHLRHYPRI